MLRPQWELVALFGHEGFRIADRSIPDVWRFRWGGEHSSGHAAEKPVGLMARAIEVSGGDGLVVDPFAGSGTTLVAAASLGRKAIGIEAEERYCELAATRLSQASLLGAPVTRTIASTGQQYTMKTNEDGSFGYEYLPEPES